MADASAPQPPAPSRPAQATVADIMQPALTTVEQNDHVAAAAYLMKHAGATALVVLDAHTGQPIGIITDADIAHAVADGTNLNDARIRDVMTSRPTVISPTTSIREAAEIMTTRRFRHLPVDDDTGLAGMVDIADVCRALIDPDLSWLPRTGTAKPE